MRKVDLVSTRSGAQSPRCCHYSAGEIWIVLGLPWCLLISARNFWLCRQTQPRGTVCNPDLSAERFHSSNVVSVTWSSQTGIQRTRWNLIFGSGLCLDFYLFNFVSLCLGCTFFILNLETLGVYLSTFFLFNDSKQWFSTLIIHKMMPGLLLMPHVPESLVTSSKYWHVTVALQAILMGSQSAEPLS